MHALLLGFIVVIVIGCHAGKKLIHVFSTPCSADCEKKVLKVKQLSRLGLDYYDHAVTGFDWALHVESDNAETFYHRGRV